MFYKSITLKNFKGVREAHIDLSNNRIVTLVGLNESGKTTILEGTTLFYNLCRGKTLYSKDLKEMRPKGIDFTGSIEIKCELFFEEQDYRKLNRKISASSRRSNLEYPEIFSYSYKFNYDLHDYIDSSHTARFEARSKSAKSKLFVSNNDLWQELVAYIKSSLIPDILFYEDFIFQIPDEIPFSFLQTVENEDGIEVKLRDNDEKFNVYRFVLDDILKSVSDKFESFEKNVVDIWHTDRDTAIQRMNIMEKRLDDVITTTWKDLFESSHENQKPKRLNFKEIKINYDTDDYEFKVSFKVKSDTGKEFSINERSKGFKWFFSFLIFTEFRKNRAPNILFLLDEPASNLHSSAQLKILNAIEQLSDRSMIIYSTHSHHLINPKWLSGAYVVLNEAISAANLEGALTETDAKITVEKYYRFVNKSDIENESIFFQPILDSLDYKRSSLDLPPIVTICEGKNDWYTFKYISEVLFEDHYKFYFYPGKGRDANDPIIRLYLSWGAEFILILLSGKGEREAELCEQVIMNSGLEYTIVRASWFNQNFSESFFLDPILAGHVALPKADAKVPYVDTDDIADVVVKALMEDQHNGQVYQLTGPRCLTFEEVIKEISMATGREIQFTPITLSAYEGMLKEAGVHEDYIWLVGYLFNEVLGTPGNDEVYHDIEKVLGRKPKDFTEYVQETVATGVWNATIEA